MDRRAFLRRAGGSGMGMALGLGPAFWHRVLAAPAAPVQPGDGPYGPLGAPDANGVQLPEGFSARIVANGLQPVPGTTYVWHIFPDGGACYPADDGGWIYVSNSENPLPTDFLTEPAPPIGAVSAMRFAPDGSVVDAYRILEGSACNCAGGTTPWGTWLSCEEWEVFPDAAPLTGYAAGLVWECDPTGAEPAVARPAMGRFKHEMAAVDPDGRTVYLTEDLPDGRLYRFTPTTWGDLSAGLLEAAAVDGSGAVTWVEVPDPTLSTGVPTRQQAAGATAFDGGEGCVYDQGRVFFTTKNDDRVWVLDIAAQTIQVLYDAAEFPNPVLDGVDNIIVSGAHDLYVAEDGGNMEVCIITPDLQVAPVVRLTGPQHGFDNGTPIPTVSEVTGLAFSPDGNRLYLNSERGNVAGILYEVTGPWRGGTLASAPSPDRAAGEPRQSPTPTPASSGVATTDTLPTTGGDAAPLVALGAAAAGLVALRARRSAERSVGAEVAGERDAGAVG